MSSHQQPMLDIIMFFSVLEEEHIQLQCQFGQWKEETVRAVLEHGKTAMTGHSRLIPTCDLPPCLLWLQTLQVNSYLISIMYWPYLLMLKVDCGSDKLLKLRWFTDKDTSNLFEGMSLPMFITCLIIPTNE